MRIESQASLVLSCALVFSSNAFGQSRCDCTSIIGSCTAEVTVDESFIEVTSNVEQCARVDYLVDGTPFVSLLVDGTERRDRTGQNGAASVIVQGCQVCLENAVAANTSFGSGLYSEGEATTLIEVDPVYPVAALDAGIEGYVELRFSVAADGTVSSPEVVAAEPQGVFEEAALDAIRRWRYTSSLEGETQTVTERLEFDLANELFSLRPRAGDAPRPVVVTEPESNSCIHEETRYDFGAMIDVSLINACAAPLIVYSCSAGTGSYVERWVCRNQEASGTALRSSAGDGASVLTDGAGDQFATVTRLDITRAPNSEYWWLACAVEDSVCRSDGRQWIRSMDRQTASIDPQDRTRARLARSF